MSCQRFGNCCWKKWQFSDVYYLQLSVRSCCRGLIAWDGSFPRKVYLAQAKMMLWRLWPCQRQSEKWWTAVTCGGPQDPHSWSRVATHSEMVSAPLFCTQLNVLCGCYLSWMCACACPFMFLYEHLACRGGWSGLENILCDSTSAPASLASDIPPLITVMQHFWLFIHCALSKASSWSWMLWRSMNAANFKNLPEGEMEKKICSWAKIVKAKTVEFETQVLFF